ncbi:type II secretion system protein [Geothermobacter hydrogeniphilus]|nr:type II secretion system protein [Geothermobacter hydrogeniphilus]
MGRRYRVGQKGLSLIELIVTMAILAVLASAVLPMAEVTVKRTREIELQRSLRIVRHAIDAYKADFDRAVAEKKIIVSINDTGYPEGLEVLLEGKDWGGLYPFKKRYLRRIPKDPFDRYNEGWGLRSLEDDPDSTVWGGDNVYDIYSQSDAIGLDGTPYNTW